MRIIAEMMFYVIGWMMCTAAFSVFLMYAIIMSPIRAMDDADRFVLQMSRSRRLRRLTNWVP